MTAVSQPNITYPDSDGQPMSDNTKQFRWIVTIKENLELLFADRPDVFVAGDLLWYPVQGSNTICQAPDAMVVLGRGKGDRGSYKQWEEGNVAPQVVFEILSPGNRLAEMVKKFKFYERYGVQEYYVYDPDDVELTGWFRPGTEAGGDSEGIEFEGIENPLNWVSPLLRIRFLIGQEELEIYRPDGQKFLTFLELGQRAEAERQRAEAERQRAEAAEALLEWYRSQFGELP
ncbi:MAG: Uma2 family endonuclease [Drouetiella hepatica Uher 2000/2452]|jgi:Uma2 family endonuclease|uniref:Uma2 family endonuclease n=1 Tax=Drouetiella hepatica Uher 2000/2452 TaxID=904376 RepID=A0A951UNB3_9CYAN|nr:Uma2 family endonuclease [Drouetiella hepatica Uher 2000/2452]